MKLLVDLGNTCLKWATLAQNELGPQQRVTYQKDNIQACLSQYWQNLPCPEHGIWLSNVAGPQQLEMMQVWVWKQWGIKLTVVETTATACGVTNGYINPKQLGIDRWLAILGAYHLIKGNLCVVDCGTAVTLDVVAETGLHLGGLIMPGVKTMQHSLLKATQINGIDKINGIEKFEKFKVVEKQLLAYDTQSGIILGTLYAVVGWIEYIMNGIEKPGQKLTLIVTGGNVPELLPYFSKQNVHIPDLVLQGLFRLVEQI